METYGLDALLMHMAELLAAKPFNGHRGIPDVDRVAKELDGR